MILVSWPPARWRTEGHVKIAEEGRDLKGMGETPTSKSRPWERRRPAGF
jgi:hypothetical protein